MLICDRCSNAGTTVVRLKFTALALSAEKFEEKELTDVTIDLCWDCRVGLWDSIERLFKPEEKIEAENLQDVDEMTEVE